MLLFGLYVFLDGRGAILSAVRSGGGAMAAWPLLLEGGVRAYWEPTRACDLAWRHCGACASGSYSTPRVEARDGMTLVGLRSRSVEALPCSR